MPQIAGEGESPYCGLPTWSPSCPFWHPRKQTGSSDQDPHTGRLCLDQKSKMRKMRTIPLLFDLVVLITGSGQLCLAVVTDALGGNTQPVLLIVPVPFIVP
jgi:hypothetical protein